MTLQEAIDSYTLIGMGDSECASECAQLAIWLTELDERRQEGISPSKYIDSNVLKREMLKCGFRSLDQTVSEFIDSLPSADVISTEFHDKGILGDCCHVYNTIRDCPIDFVQEDDDYCPWGVKWTEDLYGKWKEKNSHTQYCSECGFEETVWRTSEYKFCPNCGTKMKG